MGLEHTFGLRVPWNGINALDVALGGLIRDRKILHEELSHGVVGDAGVVAEPPFAVASRGEVNRTNVQSVQLSGGGRVVSKRTSQDGAA